MYDKDLEDDIRLQEIALGIWPGPSSGPCDKNFKSGVPYRSTLHGRESSGLEEEKILFYP
jgi:hypothetical protein